MSIVDDYRNPDPPKLDAYKTADQLTKEEATQLLAQMTPPQLEALFHNWEFLAREDQCPPSVLPNGLPWQFWLFLAGRGSGKTRSGAEWIRHKVKQGERYLGLIAPTTQDIRKVMVEGSSGVLSCAWDKDVDIFGNEMGIPDYEPSKGHKLTWKNGAIAYCYSAEEPDRLRGPQHGAIWADELAAWKYMQEAWDMAMFGLRLGANPQAMISTTPRPLPLVRELLRSPFSVVTHSSTYANAVNLAASFINIIVKKYEGTRLGKQELMGLILEELEGALWSREMVDDALLRNRFEPDMLRVVVAIDPAITENPTSNLTGIVVAGLGVDYHGYLIDDKSDRYKPNEWAGMALKLFDQYKADRIVAEGNQGGDMVRNTITTLRPNAPVSIVHASRSKQARAEPVSALYEQKRIHHIRPFPELEDQLCTWEPLSGDESPDRLDALVWAFTNLMLTGVAAPVVLPFVHSIARNIPGQNSGVGRG